MSEGKLTRDGALHEPKLGLLDYMLRALDPAGGRDLVFVPVGINYDRVLEDRALLANAFGETAGGALAQGMAAARFALRNAGQWLLRRWHRFGYACVNFGTPISMRAWVAERGLDLRALPREERGRRLEEVGRELMAAVGRVVPVLPVSLVAAAFLEAEGAPLTALELHLRTQVLARRLGAAGAHVYVPRTDEDYATAVGLRMLTLRHLVEERGGAFVPVERELPLLRYYANAIRHLGAQERAAAPARASGAS